MSVRPIDTGLAAAEAGYEPVTIDAEAGDHEAYYPGSYRIHMRFTGDRATGRLLGVQLFGHKDAEIAKRVHRRRRHLPRHDRR